MQSNINSVYLKYPLYTVELSSFMYSKGTAEKYLNRNWCSSVDNMSVYSTFTPRGRFADKKTIVLAAAISGRSLFHEPGRSDAETI